MPIRDWGGGRELSGVFEGLADQFLSTVEAAKNRQIRQSKEDQAAEDAETYDKWVNGDLSDEAWLAYIQKRIQESSGDKQELQQWTEAFNKHSRAIEDGQIEAAYQAGDISIHDLIAHYNTRMTDSEINSPEHRELQDRYFNLVDQRDADYIDQQSMVIVDRIERGQSSYAELLSFYEGMLGQVRSSSPLRSQIQRQIINIRQVVDGVTGGRGGSGGSGGSGGTGAADSLAIANDKITEMYRLGNVFVPTGEAVVRSVFEMFDIENSEDAILKGMEADSKYIEEMMDDWKENPNDATLRTLFGQELPNTPETRWLIHNQAIATYDMRAAMLNAMGRPDDAVDVQGHRDDYVEDIMQADNSIAAQDMWAVNREVFNQSVNLAGSVSDPTTAMELYRRAGKSFARSAQRFIGQSNRALPEFKLDDDMLGELDYANQLGQLFENAGSMSPEEILSQASMLVDIRPEGFWLDSSQIENIIGTTEGATGAGLVGRAAAKEGYRATEDLRAGRPAEVEPWVYVARPGETTPTLVKQSQVATYLGITDGDWMAATRPFAERINIRERPVIVYRGMEAMPSVPWFKDDKGRWVTGEAAQEVGLDPFAIAEKGWTREEIPQLAGWRQVTDGDGKTWYVDPADGQLYEKLPFRAGILGSGFDPADLVGKDGKLNLQRNQGSAGMVMGVGRGVSLKWAQNLAMDAVMAGEIDLSQYHPRDVGSGKVEFGTLTQFDVEGMFWSPADKALQNYTEAAMAVASRQGRNSDTRRELAMRNEFRRVARVREWWENTRNAALAQETRDIGETRADPINIAAQQSGIRIAQRHRMIDEQASPANQGAFRVPEAVAPRTSPVSLDAVRPPRIEAAPLPSVRPVDIPEKPSYATNPVRSSRVTRAPLPSSRRPVVR
jgi:hypothetical protein